MLIDDMFCSASSASLKKQVKQKMFAKTVFPMLGAVLQISERKIQIGSIGYFITSWI